MSQHDPAQVCSPDPTVGDVNVAKLLAKAYRPVLPANDFARAVVDEMEQVARDRAAAGVALPRAAKMTMHARLGWLASMAAMLALIVTGLYLLRPTTPPNQPLPPTANSPFPSDHLTARPRPLAPADKPAVPGEFLVTHGDRKRFALPDGSTLLVNQHAKLRVLADRRLRLEQGDIYVEVAPRTDALGVAAPFVVETSDREVVAIGTKFEVSKKPEGTDVLVTQGKVKVSGVKDTVRAGQRVDAAGNLVGAPRVSHTLAWTRELLEKANSPLVPKSEHAGGSLIVKDQEGKETKLELRKVHVDLHVEDGFARTTIDQTYFNHANMQLEGTFYFPLPADATLTRLAMYVDGKLMEGGIAERGHAANVYETIRYTLRDPALLEWLDGTTFKMRVFPLEARQEKRIILSYTQRLETLFGRTSYRFPQGHSAGEVRDWSFHARVKNGADLHWASDSHDFKQSKDGKDLVLDTSAKKIKPVKDVSLTFVDGLELVQKPAGNGSTVTFSTSEQDGAKYLMMRYRPFIAPQSASRGYRPRRDWIFLFESSGDRDPLLARVQVEVLRSILQNAEHDDSVSVVTASTRINVLEGGPRPLTPNAIQAAVDHVERSHLVGALDLDQAVKTVRRIAQPLLNPVVVHLGSGIPALGARDSAALARSLAQDKLTYVGVAVGKRWSRAFMKTAAELTGGIFVQINPDDNISWRSFDLLATLDTPRLFDVQVRAGDHSFLTFSNWLNQGEEICAVARFGADEPLPEELTLSAVLHGQPIRETLPVQAPAPIANYLPRTWAKLEIDRLYAEDADQNKQQIIDLSLEHFVMSPFTSLLVLENEKMYKDFNVHFERGKHWAKYDCPEKIDVVFEPDPRNPITARQNNPNFQPTNADQILETILVRIPPSLLRLPDVLSPFGGNYVVNALHYLQNSVYAIPSLDENGPDGSLWDSGEAIIETTVSADPSVEMPLGVFRSSGLGWAGGVGSAFGGGLVGFGGEVGRITETSSPGPISPGGADPERRSLANTLDQRFAMATQIRRLEMAVTDSTKSSNVTRKLRDEFSELRISGFDRNSKDSLASQSTMFLAKDMERLDWSSAKRRQLEDHLKKISATIEQQPGAEPLDQLSERSLVGLTLWPYRQGKRTYRAPQLEFHEVLFHDLLMYASGLNTSRADCLAVVDAEAPPRLDQALGKVDEKAKQLIDQARARGWQRVRLPAHDGQPALELLADGQGRFVWQRTPFPGLREQVVCDGTTLWHLYPEIGLAARRPFSAAHRQEHVERLPWFLPPTEDLARGHDVRLLDPRTVAIVPRPASENETPDVNALHLHLVFAADGRLTERRLVHARDGKVVSRELYAADGNVEVRNADDKVIRTREFVVEDGAEAPNLVPKTADLVVVPMPFRSSSFLTYHGRKDPNLAIEDYTEEHAIQCIAAYVAEKNPYQMFQVFTRRFRARGDCRIGFYVLWAAAGGDVDSERHYFQQARMSGRERRERRPNDVGAIVRNAAQPFANVLVDHPDSLLARYLAFHSAIHEQRESRRGLLPGPRDGFLQRLAAFRACVVQMNLLGEHVRTVDRLTPYLETAREFDGTAFGWFIVQRLQDIASPNAAEVQARLADEFARYVKVQGLEYYAAYESAACRFRAGQVEQARAEFIRLVRDDLERGSLPYADSRLRTALFDEKSADNAWTKLLRDVVKRLIETKRRGEAVAVAYQAWQLGDAVLAEELVDLAVHGVTDREELFEATLAAIDFHWAMGKTSRAETLLDLLLEDEVLCRSPYLWRLSAGLASRRENGQVGLARLEKAIELEFRQVVPVVDLDQVRQDYQGLLLRYHRLASAMKTLGVEPPADFPARIVRAADRWRSLDRDNVEPCNLAARTLRVLEVTDLAWDYMTTPVAMQPAESDPWLAMASQLASEGDVNLADRAYVAAYQAEPTNAQILWDRAQLLERARRTEDARKVYRQIADGKWQPRFTWIQGQAKARLAR